MAHLWNISGGKKKMGKRLIALLVIPKDIVDYQHFELTSREKGVCFQERSYNR